MLGNSGSAGSSYSTQHFFHQTWTSGFPSDSLVSFCLILLYCSTGNAEALQGKDGSIFSPFVFLPGCAVHENICPTNLHGPVSHVDQYGWKTSLFMAVVGESQHMRDQAGLLETSYDC